MRVYTRECFKSEFFFILKDIVLELDDGLRIWDSDDMVVLIIEEETAMLGLVAEELESFLYRTDVEGSVLEDIG